MQQHLDQLEQQVDKLKKERDQKQCQLDSLDQVGGVMGFYNYT